MIALSHESCQLLNIYNNLSSHDENVRVVLMIFHYILNWSFICSAVGKFNREMSYIYAQCEKLAVFKNNFLYFVKFC